MRENARVLDEAEGAWLRVIFIVYFFLTVVLLIASYGKTCNLQSKESRNQNPTYGISVCVCV